MKRPRDPFLFPSLRALPSPFPPCSFDVTLPCSSQFCWSALFRVLDNLDESILSEFCAMAALTFWPLRCSDFCATMVVPLRVMGYGLVPALSHMGKWWSGWSRSAFLPCDPRGCNFIPWSDLSCFLLFCFLDVSDIICAFVSCFTAITFLLLLDTISVSLYFCVLCWFLWLGSLLFFFFNFHLCSSLSMVRGCKMQVLWPMPSPGNFIFGTFCLPITYIMHMTGTYFWVSVASALIGSVFSLASVTTVANSALLAPSLALFVGYLSCLVFTLVWWHQCLIASASLANFIFFCLLVITVFNGFYIGLLPFSCTLEVFLASSYMLFDPSLAYVCWEVWFFVQLDWFFGLPLSSCYGFLSSLACWWGGVWGFSGSIVDFSMFRPCVYFRYWLSFCWVWMTIAQLAWDLSW